MKELLQKTITLSKSKKITKWANALLIYLSLEISRPYLIFKISSDYHENPFIPKHIDCIIFSEYINGALIAFAGFFLALILKLYQQNYWVLITGILTILVFYIYSWLI